MSNRRDYIFLIRFANLTLHYEMSYFRVLEAHDSDAHELWHSSDTQHKNRSINYFKYLFARLITNYIKE